MVGYDLSDRIKIITSWDELDSDGRKVFNNDKASIRFLSDYWGQPFFKFEVGQDNDKYDYYVQYQSKGGSSGWLVLTNSPSIKIGEYGLLKLLGIESLGIELDTVINTFIK